MSSYLVRHTRLVTDPFVRQKLMKVYEKTLKALEKLPRDYFYRQQAEEIVKERARIVSENTSIEEIEKQVKCGDMEEIVLQADNELSLARNMSAWQPWVGTAQKNPSQWQWPPVP